MIEDLVYTSDLDRPLAVINPVIPQIVYDHWRNPVHISANEIRFIKEVDFSEPFLKLKGKEEIFEYISRRRQVHFTRTYAMGDVIMCMPFLRFLQKKFPKTMFVLRTKEEYFDLFRYDRNFILRHTPTNSQVDSGRDGLVLQFDNVFEWDHSLSHPFKDLHRTDILYHLFQIPIEEREYDFNIYTGRWESIFCQNFIDDCDLYPGGFTLFSWRGSSRMKTLPVGVRQELVRRLSDIRPVVVTDSQERPEGMFEHPKVHWFTGHPLLCAMEMFRYPKFSLVADSGSLWFAHAASCPTVCLFGPTNPLTRLNHHPLYGEGKCIPIDLRSRFGCPAPCNEVDAWCERTARCFSEADPGFIVDKISEATVTW